MSDNAALAGTLESENKKIIRLLTKKSEETVEKLIAVRQLDELNMQLSLLQTTPRPHQTSRKLAGTRPPRKRRASVASRIFRYRKPFAKEGTYYDP